MLNVQTSTVGKAKQFASPHDSEVNVWKVSRDDFPDLLEEKFKTFHLGLAVSIAQAFLIEESNGSASLSNSVAFLSKPGRRIYCDQCNHKQ